MEFELKVCSEGEKWFPWNYGRDTPAGRVGMATAKADPGLTVINAVSPSGRILGSCSLRVGYRHSEYLLDDDEFQYGALGAGPAYFWPDDGLPWIMTLRSFWVRPKLRREGIARAFAEYAQRIGLPTYLAFANKAVEEWFDREFIPGRKRSRLQLEAAKAIAGGQSEEMPDRPADFSVYLQAESSAMRLWRSFSESEGEIVQLTTALFEPDRMDEWAADSGEDYEAGFSDSVFAYDRSFGCVLYPMVDEWGPGSGPYDEVEDDGDFDAAGEAYEKESRFAAGVVEGWVTDAPALRSYATVRRYLRTLEWHQFATLDEAIEDLFVRDLEDLPRGLHRFDALVRPATLPSA